MNYNNFIEAALKEGADFEQIAAAFSNALNEKQKVVKEQKAKNEAREEYIALLLDNMDHWWYSTDNEDGLATIAIAADVATYAVSETHEGWTADRLRKFNEDAKDQLEALVELYEMEDKGDPYALDLRRMLDMANEGKKKVEKCDCNDKKTLINDKEMLLKFLESLGL